MAMTFKTEQKGQMFLVLNGTTGAVKGRFKTKGEADVYAQRLQRDHNSAIDHIQARQDPPVAQQEEELDS